MVTGPEKLSKTTSSRAVGLTVSAPPSLVVDQVALADQLPPADRAYLVIPAACAFFGDGIKVRVLKRVPKIKSTATVKTIGLRERERERERERVKPRL